MKLLVKLLLILVIVVFVIGVYVVGDVEVGKNKVLICVVCYGVDGNSIVLNFLKLVGQLVGYIVK